jgi:predicted DNA-binding transcriptional regulator AlpA
MHQTASARVPGPPLVDSPLNSVSSLAFKSTTAGRPSEERYVSRRELRVLFPVSDMTIWRWMRDPQVAFPRAIKLGRSGRNFWWFPAILEWELKRAESTSSGPAPRDAR